MTLPADPSDTPAGPAVANDKPLSPEQAVPVSEQPSVRERPASKDVPPPVRPLHPPADQSANNIDKAVFDKGAAEQHKNQPVDLKQAERVRQISSDEIAGALMRQGVVLQLITNNNYGSVSGESLIIGNAATINRTSTSHQSNGKALPASPDTESNEPWPRSAFQTPGLSAADFSFFVSAAAFEGLTLGDIRRASANLAARLESFFFVPVDEKAPRSPLRLGSIDDFMKPFGLETVSVKGPSGNDRLREVVRFSKDGAAEVVLLYAVNRLHLSSQWPSMFFEWLKEMGSSDDYEVRVAAGRAAGLFLLASNRQVDSLVIHNWFSSESIGPLDALDACYSIAAKNSEEFRSHFKRRLMHWGNFGEGIDGIFALRQFSAGAYWTIDRDSCLDALGRLATRSSIVALMHAQDAYDRLLVKAIDQPDDARLIFASLTKALPAGNSYEAKAGRLQVILVTLSLLEIELKDRNSGKYFCIDRIMGELTDFTEMATIMNAAMVGGSMQATSVRAYRDLFRRQICARHDAYPALDPLPILVLLRRMHEIGDKDQQERLEYYLSDWCEALAEDCQERPAFRAAKALHDQWVN